MRTAGILLALLAFLSAPARAAGPVVRVGQVDASGYPTLRAYVTVAASSGVPLPHLPRASFTVYEKGSKARTPRNVRTLEASKLGAAVAVVVQGSGAMSPVLDEIKKAAGAFLSGLSEEDRASLVVYSDRVETLAPTGDKAAAAAAAAGISNPGWERLLFDGAMAGLEQLGASSLPAVRAVVLVADGGDSGSGVDKNRLLAEIRRKGVSLYAVGHSSTGGDDLHSLRDLVREASGEFAYVEAAGAGDFTKAFARIHALIAGQYVVDWKAGAIDADGRTYPVEVEVAFAGTRLRGAAEVTTPVIRSYRALIAILASVVLLGVVGALVYVRTRPPVVFCPSCRKEQMPDWDACLFCLKTAKATLEATHGAAKGMRFPLVGKTVKIGKGPENAVRIPDPSVSSNHCGIEINGTRFEVVDLGSSNGTRVNGRRVQRRSLRNGDVISIGQSELRFASSVVDAEDGDYPE